MCVHWDLPSSTPLLPPLLPLPLISPDSSAEPDSASWLSQRVMTSCDTPTPKKRTDKRIPTISPNYLLVSLMLSLPNLYLGMVRGDDHVGTHRDSPPHLDTA